MVYEVPQQCTTELLSYFADVQSHDEALQRCLRRCSDSVPCWGQRGKLQDRSYERHHVWKERPFGYVCLILILIYLTSLPLLAKTTTETRHL